MMLKTCIVSILAVGVFCVDAFGSPTIMLNESNTGLVLIVDGIAQESGVGGRISHYGASDSLLALNVHSTTFEERGMTDDQIRALTRSERKQFYKQQILLFRMDDLTRPFFVHDVAQTLLRSFYSVDYGICINEQRDQLLYCAITITDDSLPIDLNLYVVNYESVSVRKIPYLGSVESRSAPSEVYLYHDQYLVGSRDRTALQRVSIDDGQFLDLLDARSVIYPRGLHPGTEAPNTANIELPRSLLSPRRLLFLDNIGVVWTNQTSDYCLLAGPDLEPADVLSVRSLPDVACDISVVNVFDNERVVYGRRDASEEFAQIVIFDPASETPERVIDLPFRGFAMVASRTQPIVRMIDRENSSLVEVNLETGESKVLLRSLDPGIVRILPTF